MKSIAASEELLHATLQKDAKAVAKGIEEAHREAISILQYHNENALSCAVSLAYFSAKTYYVLIHEMPTGRGVADIVFLPRKNHPQKPAIIVELKWDKSAEGAIGQIKRQQYVESIQEFTGKILLVGISYDKKKKEHQCVIEEIIKERQ